MVYKRTLKIYPSCLTQITYIYSWVHQCLKSMSHHHHHHHHHGHGHGHPHHHHHHHSHRTIIVIIINILMLSIIINIMIIHFFRWTELDINHLHECTTITISTCNILQNIFMSVGHNRRTAFDYLLCLKLTIHILTFLYFLFTVECCMFPRPRKTEPRFKRPTPGRC